MGRYYIRLVWHCDSALPASDRNRAVRTGPPAPPAPAAAFRTAASVTAAPATAATAPPAQLPAAKCGICERESDCVTGEPAVFGPERVWTRLMRCECGHCGSEAVCGFGCWGCGGGLLGVRSADQGDATAVAVVALLRSGQG